MSERDIEGTVAALIGAIATNQEAVATEAAVRLLRGFLIDVNRIANALEGLMAVQGMSRS